MLGMGELCAETGEQLGLLQAAYFSFIVVWWIWKFSSPLGLSDTRVGRKGSTYQHLLAPPCFILLMPGGVEAYLLTNIEEGNVKSSNYLAIPALPP